MLHRPPLLLLLLLLLAAAALQGVALSQGHRGQLGGAQLLTGLLGGGAERLTADLKRREETEVFSYLA